MGAIPCIQYAPESLGTLPNNVDVVWKGCARKTKAVYNLSALISAGGQNTVRSDERMSWTRIVLVELNQPLIW